jgi:hypothetical protein
VSVGWPRAGEFRVPELFPPDFLKKLVDWARRGPGGVIDDAGDIGLSDALVSLTVDGDAFVEHVFLKRGCVCVCVWKRGGGKKKRRTTMRAGTQVRGDCALH